MDKANPYHIGIIMDGNGRWAEERGLSRSRGHRAGANTLKKLCQHVVDLEIPYLSVFAFSTENFKRTKTEVQYLMNLFVELFKKELDFLIEDGVKVVFSGKREPLPPRVLKAMDEIVQKTSSNTKCVFNVCLNYGGKSEIVDMTKNVVQKVQNGELSLEDIDEEVIDANLYQPLPPIDLVIRTSGELRISNFMLWQSAYAEFYFPKKYFPDFGPEDLDIAIEEFRKRNRRFGGVKK